MRLFLARRAAVTALSAFALLAGAGSLAATAADASTTVTATTSVTNHPDTTNVSGGACNSTIEPQNGPVWAFDNYQSQITAVAASTPANTYAVTITDTGSYVAFADPTTCVALLSTGSLTGTYDLTVTSPVAPSASSLKASYNGVVSTTQMVQDFFSDQATDVVGGDYDFSYQGGNYVQNTAGETGDVKAVACTVSVSNIADQTSVLNKAISPLQVTATSNYPTSGMQYAAKNLPKGLHINQATGKITGTPTGVGTNMVTVGAINATYSTEAALCADTTTFKWTVRLTAPGPSSSPSGNGYPTGGVQTGGGKPVTSPWLPFGLFLAVISGLGMTTGVVSLRRQHQDR